MKNNSTKIYFALFLVITFWTCNLKRESSTKFKLQSVWEYDSVSHDSTLFPQENEFEEIVESHIALFQNQRMPEFVYNIYLDTIYHEYNTEGTHGRSVRAAVISQLTDLKLLLQMLNDKRLNDIWSSAKRDSSQLRTTIEMIKERLSALDDRKAIRW